MNRLRNRIFIHITRQEIGFFDRVRTGELVNRLSEVGLNMPSSPLRWREQNADCLCDIYACSCRKLRIARVDHSARTIELGS